MPVTKRSPGRAGAVRALLAAFLVCSPHSALHAQAVASPESTAPAASLSDLPLRVVPARGALSAVAVLLTGDGGWASLDRTVADSLAAHGVQVVVLDSRKYFSKQRNPDGAAADLARVLDRYAPQGEGRRILLVGYSRGADVLPFLVTRLPRELAARTALVALIGPAHNANFKFHLVDLISNHSRGDDLATVPEIEKLAPLRVLCVYGTGEKDSACPRLAPGAADLVAMPGGHHFDGRYGEIAQRILGALAH